MAKSKKQPVLRELKLPERNFNPMDEHRGYSRTVLCPNQPLTDAYEHRDAGIPVSHDYSDPDRHCKPMLTTGLRHTALIRPTKK